MAEEKVFEKGFKGFDHEMKCRGKQYAENTVFEEEKAEMCQSGMHFCKNPFDVLDYYNLINDDCKLNEFTQSKFRLTRRLLKQKPKSSRSNFPVL